MYHMCLNWYTVCTVASDSTAWLVMLLLLSNSLGQSRSRQSGTQGKTLVGVHTSREQVEEHLEQFKIQSSDVGYLEDRTNTE